jgi:hypothetical protein
MCVPLLVAATTCAERDCDFVNERSIINLYEKKNVKMTGTVGKEKKN